MALELGRLLACSGACRPLDPATKSLFMLYHLLLVPTNPVLLKYMLWDMCEERSGGEEDEEKEKGHLMLYHLLLAPLIHFLPMNMLLGEFKERRKGEEQEETRRGHLAQERSRHNA